MGDISAEKVFFRKPIQFIIDLLVRNSCKKLTSAGKFYLKNIFKTSFYSLFIVKMDYIEQFRITYNLGHVKTISVHLLFKS